MIKLNNKNITYVALADSNNSVKGVKEVWYADSANSVKLVYRRKDALIEGEDYEKYHWILTDTGNPHIQVAYNYNTDSGAYIETRYKCNYSSSGFDMIIGFSINQNNNIGIRIFNVDNKTYVDHHKTENGILSSSRIVKLQSNINAERYIKATLNNVIIDDTEYPSINWGSGFDAINRRGTILYTNQGNNDVHYAETKLRVNNAEHDFIPCKLLKPVPKWLDANGIRRQVGECGMIDLVSGKFYGNVNSVGTFTVENYYERKEWLQGDGTAYIDTNVTSFSGVICIKFKKSVIDGTRLFGRERRNPSIADYSDRCVFQYNPSSRSVYIFGVDIGRLNSDIENEVLIDITNDIAYGIDGATASGFSITPNLEALSLYLFADHRNYGASDFSSDYIAKFSITNSINLIPCTLSTDLPAYMDANNIPRTKGTSGMWDLVSDRFYGNVANSGTFKAVNLAEGVDYEVHDWLRAEVDSKATLMTLPIGKNFSFKRRWYKGNNVQYMYGNGYTYYISTSALNNTLLWIWSTSQSQKVYTLNSASQIGADINIESTSTTLKFNGLDVPHYADNYRVYFSANTDVGVESLTSSIYVDGIERYVPVKLLRSLPSKYDANGIARQAGECGMYDTVNDVFYGNVASNGSFTVSDN